MVYFEFDNNYFPSRNWTDLAPDFVFAWLHGLIRLASGQSVSEDVSFMDGPYVVKLTGLASDRCEICFLEDRPRAKIEHGRVVTSCKALLEDAVSVMAVVQQRCHQDGWEVNPKQVIAELTEARKLLWKANTDTDKIKS